MAAGELILGEFPRQLDDRYRLSLPTELLEPLLGNATDCILAKERPGCLSLWNINWQTQFDANLELVRGKIRAGKMSGRIEEVQRLGRMLSTRHRTVQFAGRGRLVVPEGFREFLKVEPSSEVMVVGAGVCVELWQPAAWLAHLEQYIPDFQKLFDQLTS
jgi:MraZ protein